MRRHRQGAVGVPVDQSAARARRGPPRDGALVGVLGLLSVVSVIATLNPVVTVTLAFVLLRERIGASLALAGILLLAAG